MRSSAIRPASGVRLTRFRVLALTVVGLLTLVASVSIWWMRSLDELPDIGDPFDVALALRPVLIPVGDNAYEAYAKARLTREEPPPELWEAAQNAKEDALAWSKVAPGSRDYLERNRAALEIWRDGSERPDARYLQPGEMTVTTPLPFVGDAFIHAAMAALEGSRLEEQGAMSDAWKWYRAMLRSSRLVGRHGLLVERRFGADLHALAARRILRWASDQRVDAGMLRLALGDSLAADSLTSPLSNGLKRDYLMIMRELDEMKLLPRTIPFPGGQDGLLQHVVSPWTVNVRREIQQFRFRATNDQERSRRVIRLVYANWLAQIEKPTTERAPSLIHDGLTIYEFDQAAPPAARAVAFGTLCEFIDQTVLAKSILCPDEARRSEFGAGTWEGNGAFARERRRRSVLLVKLAAELYRRERGKPAPNAGALLGTYLKELPEGVRQYDPIPDEIE